MSDSDAFDEIMRNSDSESDDVIELPEDGGLWEGLEAIWPKVHEGVLVKGIIIVEYQDRRGRVLKWEAASSVSEWDVLGMMHSALADINAKAMSDRFAMELEEDEEEDDE